MQINQKQKDIIKKLEYYRYGKSVREVYCDCIEYEALKIALFCDIKKAQERSKWQQDILKQYSQTDQIKFLEICSDIENLLVGIVDDFGDYLGEIYMEIGAGNTHNQQYFTPYHVAQLMAKITVSNLNFDKNVITIGEPCCGSGGLMLAALEEFSNMDFNYADRALIVANDVDRNCVNMCYLQLAFAGASAVVLQQNTITQQVLGDTFITPAFALQFLKFNKIYRDLHQAI